MAQADRPTIYWDANLFIYLINNDERWAPSIRPLWEAALAGELRIVTSNVTLAEVAFTDREARERALSEEARIDAYMSRGPHLQIVRFDDRLALAARALIRRWLVERPPALRRARLAPSDAVQLATAQSIAAAFYTVDGTLLRIARALSVSPAMRP